MSLSRVKLALTNRCNLNCAHCYLGGRHCGDMCPSTAQSRMEEARSLGARIVDLTGGEPTMHPSFREIVEMAASLSFDTINVSTNGVRLPGNVLECMSLHSVKCNVSLDGASEDTVKAIRGPGVFRLIIEGLNEFSRRKIPFSLRFCVNKLNYCETEKMLQLARDYAVKASLEPTQFCGNAQPQLLLNVSQCCEVKDRIRKYLSSSKVQIEESFNGPLPCDGGQSDLISIAINGEAVPCLMMIESCGVECVKTLSAMIEELAGAKRKLREFRPANKCCIACTHYGLCMSGCAVTANAMGCLQ